MYVHVERWSNGKQLRATYCGTLTPRSSIKIFLKAIRKFGLQYSEQLIAPRTTDLD